MQLEEYTPRNILTAMGFVGSLPKASPAGWSAHILLMPSFDPEVSISIVSVDAGNACVEVRTLAVQLWKARRVTGHERFFSASTDVAPSVALGIRECAVRPARRGEGLVLDGMRYAMFLQEGACAAERAGHVAVDDDVATVLRELFPVLLARLDEDNCVRALNRASRCVAPKPVTQAVRLVASIQLAPEGWSPKRPKVFIVLREARCCPHCTRRAIRFRKLSDRLVCPSCARSCGVDPEVLRGAREES